MLKAFILCFMLTCTTYGLVCAQDKLSIQIKTFDQQLKPLPNLSVSINNNDFVTTGSKGIVIADVPANDLPPISIKISNEELEAESWNYSKGVLEITVRKKSYRVITVSFRNTDGSVLSNTEVSFRGKKNVSALTNSNGMIDVPLALNEKITSAEQFSVKGFTVQRIQSGEKECIVYVRPIVVKNILLPEKNKEQASTAFRDFDLKNLDSIQSLTVFYAVFKNYPMDNLSQEEKRKIDLKFKSLMVQLEDSLRNPGLAFIGRISDSSFVGADVENLLAQAEAEKQTLDHLRVSFDEKIQVLNEKLSDGIEKLDAESRTKLLNDINKLQTILRQNEQKFYKNQNDYHAVLNSLKENFFDIQDLENKLSVSEAQRADERKEFQRKLFTVFLVTISFAIVTIVLVKFSNRLKKQRSELIRVNGEVKRVNENLEALVSERTALLEAAHREMDIFLYKASHDLRGPICSIIGLCNLASRTVNPESLELVQKTYNTAYAMDRMLKKLKTISEINHPSNYSMVMLDEYIKGIKHEFKTYIRDNNIAFKIDCPAAVSFHSYPNLIEVILACLVENALFFSTMTQNRQAQIEIKALHKKKSIELSVYDNGIGIEDEIKDRVWDMFFIGNENSQGNGLGLYIVRKSVNALKGTITIESQKGAYTKVIVNIPISENILVGPRHDQQLLVSSH
jgi:signal transduction histidine kinase